MAAESVSQHGAARSQDRAAKALAEKFNLPLDKAKRLIELHRAALAREVKEPKKRYR
jgi:hypothetical protein